MNPKIFEICERPLKIDILIWNFKGLLFSYVQVFIVTGNKLIKINFYVLNSSATSKNVIIVFIFGQVS